LLDIHAILVSGTQIPILLKFRIQLFKALSVDLARPALTIIEDYGASLLALGSHEIVSPLEGSPGDIDNIPQLNHYPAFWGISQRIQVI
jgi:hypothetical protein